MIKINEMTGLPECNTSEDVVLVPARTEPLTNAHKEYFRLLCNNFKKTIFIIGSRYVNGTERHCIPATIRAKMIFAILEEMQIPRTKYEVVGLSDYPTDEEWLKYLLEIKDSFGAEYISTGNEWVVNIVNSANCDLTVIDPKLQINIPYHATDVRRTLVEEHDYEKLQTMIPRSSLQILFSRDWYKSIILSAKHEAVEFLPGRQTVDMVFLLKDLDTNKLYVIMGKRDNSKQDFPGVLALPGSDIKGYELSERAIQRIFKEETGLSIEILQESLLETPIRIQGVETAIITMKMVGIYSSDDIKKAGTQGGSSECFTTYIEGDVAEFRKLLSPKKDLYDLDFYEVNEVLNLPLAFQHKEMIERARYMSLGVPKFEKDISSINVNSKQICFIGGPGSGKSTAALGTMFFLKILGISCEITGEFTKDEVYENHLSQILDDQAYIISQQNRRVHRLNSKVNYIITDAPLLISAYHASKDKTISEFAKYLFDKTTNHIIFVNKDDKVVFETKGRLEDEKKSKKISEGLKELLISNNYEFEECVGSIDAIKLALRFVANDVLEQDEELEQKLLALISKVEVLDLVRF